MKFMRLLNIIIVGILLSTCVTTMVYNRTDPYPNMEIVSFGYTKGYEFKNDTSKKLLIILEGSSWNSVLGEKRNNRWYDVMMGSQMLQVLQDTYTIFIPEKFNREPGINYFDDFDERARYTFDNLLTCYREVITEYLAQSDYESIVMIGNSEGAFLLPLLYYQLDSTRISLLVSCFGGGLFPHEIFNVLVASEVTPTSWKKMYMQVIEAYKNKPYPDSLEIGFMGMPFRYWSSMVDIRPVDYYQNIDIPVLFVQGEKDYRVPKRQFKSEVRIFVLKRPREASDSLKPYRDDY